MSRYLIGVEVNPFRLHGGVVSRPLPLEGGKERIPNDVSSEWSLYDEFDSVVAVKCASDEYTSRIFDVSSPDVNQLCSKFV